MIKLLQKQALNTHLSAKVLILLFQKPVSDMQRLSALLLLLLLCWQIAGWQLMRLLQLTQPESREVTICGGNHAAKPLQIIAVADNEAHLLNWTRPGKEFVLNGKWYDIERKERCNGITYYHCISDAADTYWAEEMEKQLAGNNIDNSRLPPGEGALVQFVGKVFFAPARYAGLILPQSFNLPSGCKVLASPASALAPDVPTPPPQLVL